MSKLMHQREIATGCILAILELHLYSAQLAIFGRETEQAKQSPTVFVVYRDIIIRIAVADRIDILDQNLVTPTIHNLAGIDLTRGREFRVA
ncbi:hypothetical protein [Bifidobacterium ramosum]|uniref:hypothetical protein n=1 Tax=Bifidobacterium ramosum TaxID=1798158 RepID=UPI001952DDBA|nr:hypothetical protein [Bifidobacterium ramosum]